MKTTVPEIVRDKLCLGCGTCEGICAFNAISMVYSSMNRTYVPRINEEECTYCGLCYEVCPGLHMGLPKAGCTILPDNKNCTLELGGNMKCFTGYACDEKIRHNATSGGIATALSLYLLESKKEGGRYVD